MNAQCSFCSVLTSETRENVQPIGCRLSPHTRACILCSQTATGSTGLPFNSLHPHNPCNDMDYYTFTDHDGMESWVGQIGWLIADTLPTSGHMSTTDQAKIRKSQQPQTDVLTTEPCQVCIIRCLTCKHWSDSVVRTSLYIPGMAQLLLHQVCIIWVNIHWYITVGEKTCTPGRSNFGYQKVTDKYKPA